MGVAIGLLIFATIFLRLILKRRKARKTTAILRQPTQRRYDNPELDAIEKIRCPDRVELDGSAPSQFHTINRKPLRSYIAHTVTDGKEVVHEK